MLEREEMSALFTAVHSRFLLKSIINVNEIVD